MMLIATFIFHVIWFEREFYIRRYNFPATKVHIYQKIDKFRGKNAHKCPKKTNFLSLTTI